MTPAAKKRSTPKKRGPTAAAKRGRKTVKKSTPRRTKKGARTTSKGGAKKRASKRTGSSAGKRKKRAAKTARKTARQTGKKTAKKTVRKTTKKAAKRQAPKSAKKRSSASRTRKRGGTGARSSRAAVLDEGLQFVREKAKKGAAAARKAATTGLERTGETRERVAGATRQARERAEAARHRLKTASLEARERAEDARARLGEAGRHARVVVLEKAHHAHETADEALATARAVGVGTAMRVGDLRQDTMERLQAKIQDLEDRVLDAKDRGVDFFDRHREEILALTWTAVKIAAVIGVRRLTAPRERTEEGKSRRVASAVAVVSAALGQLAQLAARQPNALPLLREVYRKGTPAEQAIVGLLLDPTLRSDPDHALEVIQAFLEDASGEPAADMIAKRSLAPLLDEHPELVDQVKPWVQASAPFMRRAALIALSRILADRRSRAGDLVSATVIVLEDHDEQVRQAMRWFLQEASEVDLDATAKTVAKWLEKRGGDAERIVDGLPRVLARRVRRLRDEKA